MNPPDDCSWPTADDQKTKICLLGVAAFIKQQRPGTNPTKQGLTGFCVLLFQSVYYSFVNICDRSPHTDVKQVGGDGLTGCLYILLNSLLFLVKQGTLHLVFFLLHRQTSSDFTAANGRR
jgi:hypothetical protein